jgi:hypothetical protein
MARSRARMKVPPPGLQGTYEGSCVVCLQGCDTGLAFRGEAEWAIAGLLNLGIPQDQAAATLEAFTGSEPGMVPNGIITVPVRLCEVCLAKSGLNMQVGLVAKGGELPCYEQQPETYDRNTL